MSERQLDPRKHEQINHPHIHIFWALPVKEAYPWLNLLK